MEDLCRELHKQNAKESTAASGASLGALQKWSAARLLPGLSVNRIERPYFSSLFITVHRWLRSLFWPKFASEGFGNGFDQPSCFVPEKQMTFSRRYTAMNSDKTVPLVLDEPPSFLVLHGFE